MHIAGLISPFAFMGMASVAAIAGIGCAVLALVAKPIAEQQPEGRRLAYMSFACAVMNALICLYAAPGTNNPERVYVIGAFPFAFSVLALFAYFRGSSRRGGPGAK